MHRLVAGGAALRPLHQGGILCGPAVTVKTRPGDNLMLHMALNLAVAGDVIVVDAGGDLTNSLIGERMLAYCVAKKFAGVIVNGAVRDYGWIRAQPFPVYAAGVSHRGPYKDGPGEINVPISINGMMIEPGDVVVGDEDGFVSIPYAQAEAVCELAALKARNEAATFADIGKGDNNAQGYRKKLLDLGCSFED
jgi:regulator of RNase E activity RraA